MEENGIAEKYRASSYKSLKGKISLLSEILDNAYGKSYCQISNPTLIGNAVNLGIANANRDTFRMYTDMFLTEYIILAIHMNSQGELSDMVLNEVGKNVNLML